MSTFYTNTFSSKVLQVSSSAIMSSSAGNVLRIIGNGSSLLSITGSQGVLAEFSDVNFSDNNLLVLTSGSVDILAVKNNAVVVTGSLIVNGQASANGFTGSLFGTSSWALNVVGGGGGSGQGFPYTGSAIISGSLVITGSTSTPTIDISSATSGQIKFPASANYSTDANTLDDYQEFDFTPSLSAAGSTFNYEIQAGTYTRIGRAVTVNIFIELKTTGNTLLANALTITGLPFLALNSTNKGNVMLPIFWSNTNQTLVNVMGLITAGQSTINVYKVTAATTAPALMNASDLSTTGGSQLRTTFTYQADVV